jgi:hypothetical protein
VREFVVSGGFGYGGIRVGIGGAAVPLDLRFPIKYCLNRFLVSKISSRLRLDNFCSWSLFGGIINECHCVVKALM